MVALSDFDLLARLIAFDTTSRLSNLPLADFVCEYVDGARIHRHSSPDGTKCNLIVAFGPEGKEREGLVLSGHMDVVPAGDGWESDPFSLTDGDDRFFARGSCDMKGFLACALNVAKNARELRKPLVLVFTYDEELGTVGAHHLVENWADVGALPKSAIIGEPTSLQVVRMHKGHMKVRVTLHGESAHSGYPHLGKSAIEAAGRILVSLRGLRHRFEKAGGPHCRHFPEVPFVPLNVGRIEGGVAVNVVPDKCVLEIGARALPGMNTRGIFGSIREAVANAAGDAPFECELTGDSPPLLLTEDARIHQEMCTLTGAGSAVSYATDAGWLSTTGMECVVCGPGSIEVAHKPNEFVPKDDLVAARGLLERAVERFCT